VDLSTIQTAGQARDSFGGFMGGASPQSGGFGDDGGNGFGSVAGQLDTQGY
jgi:hypothetical protein